MLGAVEVPLGKVATLPATVTLLALGQTPEPPPTTTALEFSVALDASVVVDVKQGTPPELTVPATVAGKVVVPAAAKGPTVTPSTRPKKPAEVDQKSPLTGVVGAVPCGTLRPALEVVAAAVVNSPVMVVPVVVMVSPCAIAGAVVPGVALVPIAKGLPKMKVLSDVVLR
jgi:hypothetical protein